MRAKPDMKPWVHTDKSGLSSVGAALTHASKCPNRQIYYDAKPRTATTQTKCALLVPPLKGLNKCVSMINPGLAPWAMQEYRPYRAHCPTAPINPPIPQTIQSQSNKYKNTNECNNPFTHPNTFNEHHNTASKFRRIMSAVGTILLHSPGWNEGKARETLGTHR